MGDIIYRNTLKETDREAFKVLLESTGVFYDFEIEVALEIMDIFLKRGESSDYYFYVAELEGKPVGYINFGSTPCTRASWDIYWMAVKKDLQGHGLGKILIKMAEERIAALNGENIWIETSSRADYRPTRRFYEKTAYTPVSELRDFYDRGDNKVIFVKYLNPSR